MTDTLLRDTRHAIRALGRTPLFTIAAVLTLALAIGMNTAVFSVVDAVLLRPLPYPDPDRLALVSRVVRARGAEHAATSVDGSTWEAVRDRASSVRSAPFSTWTTGVNLIASGAAGPGQARYVRQQRVGAGFFDTLGVRPALGREFSADEDRPGGPPAALLSATLWRTLFDADPSILGRTVVLKGAPHTVVGVMPDGFQSGERADLWTPLRPSRTGEGGGENYQVLLRLRDGAGWSQAAGELALIGEDLRAARRSEAGVEITFSVMPLQQGMTGELRQPVLMLWGAVSLVLVVATVNLAGLLLARGARRERELATRVALGSGRAALVRQLTVESLVLAVAGGALGLLAGAVALEGLTWLARDAYEIWQPVSLAGRSVAVALGLSIVASLVFGLVPAVQVTRASGPSILLHGGSRAVTGAAARWPRRLIIVAQVALGVILLVGAGLLVRTFAHLGGLEPGFDPRQLIAAEVSLEDDRYRTRDRVERLFEQTLDRLEATPGVEAAAVALELPYERLLNLGFRHLDGAQATAGPSTTNATYISPRFFEALRIPVRRGRTFSSADRQGSAPVVIVSDAFVRMYFDGTDPIGRRIAVAGAEREIVGQVGDVQVRPGWGDNAPLSAMPLAYVPFTQVTDGLFQLVHGWFAPSFIVRSPLGAAAAEAAIRRAVDQTDPLLPFAAVRSMDEVKAASLAPQRFLMALLAGLAAAAVLLAAIGIHGLIATSVTERTREMGIRIALGASPARTVRTAALPGIVLALAGITIGIAGALALVDTVRAFVWGVSPSDPATFAGVAGLLLAVATLASVLPALRLLRLDPTQALRQD